MAKKTAVTLEDVKEKLAELTELIDQLDGVTHPGEAVSSDSASLPEDPDELDDKTEEEITELAKAVDLDTEEVENASVVRQLKLLIRIKLAETNSTIDELVEELGSKTKTLNALALGLKVKPEEDAKETIDAILAVFAEVVKDKPDGGAEDTAEKPAKKGKKTEPEIDVDALAEDADLPKEKVMKARLESYNDAATGEDEIEIDDETDHTAPYKELLKKMVNSDGEIAEWGKAYINLEQDMCCCGLPLTEVKGKEGHGKCQVTDTVWTQDDEGVIVQVVRK